MPFPIIPSIFSHFVSFSSFRKHWVEFCPSFTTKGPYLQPGQIVGLSCLRKFLTPNIICLTLDNEQKSTGFDERITRHSNESEISLLPYIVLALGAFL